MTNEAQSKDILIDWHLFNSTLIGTISSSECLNFNRLLLHLSIKLSCLTPLEVAPSNCIFNMGIIHELIPPDHLPAAVPLTNHA
jgi:hypothetical protein